MPKVWKAPVTRRTPNLKTDVEAAEELDPMLESADEQFHDVADEAHRGQIGAGARHSFLSMQGGVSDSARNPMVHRVRTSGSSGASPALAGEELLLARGSYCGGEGISAAARHSNLMEPQESSPMGPEGDKKAGASKGASGFEDCGGRLKADLSRPVRRAHLVLRKSALAASTDLLEREVLKEVIEEDTKRWHGCIMLPVTMLFFTFYSAAVSLHSDMTFSHLTEIPLRHALMEAPETTLADVLTVSDVWQFIEQTYVPFFFQQTDSYGEPLPRDKWSTINTYSRLVGAVEMRLQRSVTEVCEDADHMHCYPPDQLTGETFGDPLSSLPPLPGNESYWNASENVTSLLLCEDEGFSTAPCAGGAGRRLGGYLREELRGRMPSFKQDGPTYVFALDRNDSYSRILQRVKYLQDRQWLDLESTVLTLEALVENHQLLVPRLQIATCSFYFSRGGGVFTSLRVGGNPLELFVSGLSYPIDFLFLLMLLVFTIYTVRELLLAMRRGRLKQHCTGGNVVSWLTCIVGWGNMLGLFVVETARQLARTKYQAYQDDPSQQASTELYTAVKDMMSMVMWLRLFTGDAHVLFMCNCFISLQWQPRLAVVTQTLMACSSDLLHFGIVFVPTFIAFAISGMVIFGRQLIEFATIDTALATCFKIAIESEYDWHSISQKDSRTAICWVVMYLLLVVMLMLNMVLAIIMDVYQEVRMHSGDSMTMFDQLQYIYRKIYHRNQWVQDSQLLDQISEMPPTIIVSELRQAFPEMHHHQLRYLLSQCQNKAQRINRVGINKVYMQQMVAAICVGLEEVCSMLDDMRGSGWMARGIEVGSNENRVIVKEILSSIAVQNHWMGLTAKHISALQMRVQGIQPEDELQRSRSQKLTLGQKFKKAASEKSAKP